MHRTVAIALLLLLAATSATAGDGDDSPSPSPDSDFPPPTKSPVSSSSPSSSPDISPSPSYSPANSPSPLPSSSSPAHSPAIPPTAAKAKVPPRGRRGKGRKGKAASSSSDSPLLMAATSGDPEMPEELPEDELVPVWDGPTTELDPELFGAPGPSVGSDAEAVADGAPDEGEDPGFKRRKLMALDEPAAAGVAVN